MAARNNKTARKKLPFNINIIIIIICAVLLALSFRMLISDVNNRIADSNIATMKELVLHDKSTIRNDIDVRRDIMEGAEKRMAARQWTSFEELMDAENALLNNIPDADRIGLLDSEGTLYLSTGLVQKNSYYKEICDGKSESFVIRLNTESNITEAEKEALIEAIPVSYSVCGKEMKWMICQFPVSALESELKISSYDDTGFTSVIDTEGNFILNISKTHSFGEFDNLFDGLESAVFEGYKNLDEVRATTTTTTGATSVIFSLNGQKYLMVISAFDIADWYIISVVPMSVFSALSNAIIFRFILLLGIITVILAAVLYLVFRQRRERETAEKEKHQKEAEERKKLIDGITASYNVAYVVNMAEDTFEQLRMDETILGHEQEFETFTQAKEFFIGLLYPLDREQMRNLLDYDTIREKLKNQNSFDTEYRLPINGAMIWHTMNISKIDENTVTIGFAVDDLEITKKHLEDNRFSEYFALYEIDLDSETAKIVIDSPYYPVDRSGTAISYKAALLAFADSLEGEAKEFFTRISDIDVVKKAFAKEDKYSFTYRSNNVYEKWVDLTSFVTLRHADGTPAMFTLGFSYIDSFGAAKQDLQSQIAAQKEELEEALALAESASKAKTDFLFSMSHDIRTPMNAITGFTAMARKYIDDKPSVADYLEKIDASGKQLLSLINNVLEMARIESGKVELSETPVNIKQEFHTITTVLSEQAQMNGQSFNYSLEGMKHFNVFADEPKVNSITMNIISNAMKYTPEGGRIDFRFREVEGKRPGYATYVLTVTDTGIGMSEEYLDTLFDPFSRENTSTVSGIQGTGLGMAIVKRFVDIMGGEIAVRSETGNGTRFDVTLDFRINEEAESTEEKKEEESRPVSFKGLKALLVEDNELNREIALDILEDEGLEVETAEDGSAAVEMIKEKGPEFYDFILMDIQMPVMGGYEATKIIRKMYPDQHIPIIALSANAFAEDKTASKAAGMDDHVAKPIDTGELLGALAKFL